MITHPETEPRPTSLAGPRLYIARTAWILAFLSAILVFMAAFPARINQLSQDPYQLTPVLSDLGLGLSFFIFYTLSLNALFVLACMTIALLLFWRKSDDWMGLLVSLGLVSFLILVPIFGALAETRPEWRTPILFLRASSINLLVLIYYLFPDGRFSPRWTRFLAIFFILGSFYWLTIPGLIVPVAPMDAHSAEQFGLLLWVILALGSGVFAQIYRYRHTTAALQRQQTKWVLFGFTGIFLGISVSTLPLVIFPVLQTPGLPNLIYLLVEIPLAISCWMLFPVSLGLSILRYRLWDIDVIIRKTLVYGLLTVILGLVYFGAVTLAQSLFETVTGEQSPIAIVLSTLVIAALFTPLRRRVQNTIDRRFYRRKYNADKALAAFTLNVREEVDLEGLTRELLAVVDETMQPESVSVWLRELPE
jgi:hypothetical protein